MDIILDKKGNTEASIKINLKEEDYQPKIEEKVKEYRKKANLKGFRPGKVPAGLIKKMYGKGIKVEEINQMLTKSLPKFIQENNLKLVGEPIPDIEAAKNIDWDHQQEFEFVYEVGYVNDFTYELSDQVKVPQYNIKVTDKDMQETLDNLKNQFAGHEHVEKSEKEDQLKGKITQEDGDIASESARIDLSRHEESQIKQFVGAAKGDTISFDIREVFPEDYQVASLLGMKSDEVKEVAGAFQFQIEDIQRKTPAEINQELFDQVFGKDAVSGEEEFTQKMRETMEENFRKETHNLLTRDIRDNFLDNTDIETPNDFLKRWLLIKYEGQLTEEQMDKEFDQYLKDLKWNLITNKIAEDKEVNVGNEDVKNEARKLIEAQLGQSGLLDQLGDNIDVFIDNYLKGDNGNNYMNVMNQARSEKIFQVIKDNITIEEQEVDLDGFKEKVQKSN